MLARYLSDSAPAAVSAFLRDGFVVVDGPLSADLVSRLLAAAEVGHRGVGPAATRPEREAGDDRPLPGTPAD